MKILIAVIAYNEAQNIRRALEDLQSNNFGYDILVIDNGSSDNTSQIAKECGVDVLTHSINSGSSAGTLTSYFMYANKYNYDILCQFDGDGQHIASELHKIIDPVKNHNADYVIGSRFIEKEGYQSSFLRRIGISLFAVIDSKIIGVKITDITSGFRAYSRDIIKYFARYHKHEVYDTSQLLLLSHFCGAKIKEVPVRMRERLYGESEFNFINSLSFPIKAMINVVGCILQRNQIKKIMRNNNGN